MGRSTEFSNDNLQAVKLAERMYSNHAVFPQTVWRAGTVVDGARGFRAVVIDLHPQPLDAMVPTDAMRRGPAYWESAAA
jgi:hypothetical protein